MESIKKYEARLNTELSKFPALNNLEAQTQVPKSYLISGFTAVYLFLIWTNVGGIGQLFANLASVAIPAYYSLIALETTQKNDDTQFLTYWVVYASFTILEFWSSIIIYWIPAYWLFKTVFFLWLGLPSFGGARYVYASIIRPLSQNVLNIRATSSSMNAASTAHTTTAHTTSVL